MHTFHRVFGIAAMAALIVLLISGFVLAQGTCAGQGMGRGMGQGMRGQGMTGMVPGVQLTADQRSQIMAIRQQTRDRMMAVRNDRTLSASERQQRMMEIQREGHDRVMAVLTPEQREQFMAHWNNRMAGRGQRGVPGGVGGAGMGMVPGVQLSQDQMNRIAAIRQQTMNEIRAVQNNQSMTAAQKQQRIMELRREEHNRVMAVLTPQQREQFNTWWSSRPGVSTTR